MASVAFDFEKGTMDKTDLIVTERTNGIWEPNSERNVFLLDDGHFETNLELTGDYISVRFEKGTAADDGVLTHCYVDNFEFHQNNVDIVEENNYYPFGLEHKGYNQVSSSSLAEKWKYNGKELNEELGLDWYDFGARNYDPALGRWMNLDPLAEQMRRHSPYNYAFDNPVYFLDPDGMKPYGSNCCGDKPSPIERIKQGFKTFFSGLSEATEQYINDRGYSTSNGAGFKPIENKSSNERLSTYAGAAEKMNSGTEDIVKGSIQGAADATGEAAETVSEAASYTTILTGGASAPVTVPLQKTVDVVAGGANVVSSSIDLSDGDYVSVNEKVKDGVMNFVVGKAGSRLANEGTKHVTDKVDKQVQQNVIENIIGWFKEAADKIKL